MSHQANMKFRMSNAQFLKVRLFPQILQRLLQVDE
jgi:hypothetical protein